MATSKNYPVFLIITSALCIFVTFLAINFGIPSVPLLLRDRLQSQVPSHSPRQCPVVLYNKQFKTGSTVVSNILYRTSEHYGCRNVDCGTQKKLMKGNAAHVGAIGGLTMTCHSMEWNHRLISSMRAAYRADFIYIASIREPISWFKSAASFFYKLTHRDVPAEELWSKQGFKTCVDWLLEPEHYARYESMLFRTLGLASNSTDEQMFEKFLLYDLIIDHAKMNEGLEDLGRLTRWDLLPCTNSKRLTYRGDEYDTYRADEIVKATTAVARMYKIASSIRDSRRSSDMFKLER